MQRHPTLEHLGLLTESGYSVVDCTNQVQIARIEEPTDDDSDDEQRSTGRRDRVQLSQSILNMLKVNKTIHRLDIPARIIDRGIILKKVHPLLKMNKHRPRIKALKEESDHQGLQTKLFGRLLTNQGEIGDYPCLMYEVVSTFCESLCRMREAKKQKDRLAKKKRKHVEG